MKLNAFCAAVELVPGSRPKPIVMTGWYPVNLLGPFSKPVETEIYDWVTKNVKEEWLWSPYLGMGQQLGLHFQFAASNDAMLFKISWAGIEQVTPDLL